MCIEKAAEIKLTVPTLAWKVLVKCPANVMLTGPYFGIPVQWDKWLKTQLWGNYSTDMSEYVLRDGNLRGWSVFPRRADAVAYMNIEDKMLGARTYTVRHCYVYGWAGVGVQVEYHAQHAFVAWSVEYIYFPTTPAVPV